MPSLSDLQKFKSSFHDIGGQKADLLGRNLPFDDLELPAAEPDPTAQSAPAETAQASPAESGAAPAMAPRGGKPTTGTPVAPKEAKAPSTMEDNASIAGEADDLNFGTFLGTQLDDIPPPVDADPMESDVPAANVRGGGAKASTGPDSAANDAAEFYTPPELLQNLSEELASTPPDFPEGETFFDDGAAEESAADGISGAADDGLGFGDLDDFGLPGDPFAAAGTSGTENEDLGFGDLDNFGLPGDSFAADGLSGTESEDFGFGDLDGIGLSDDPFSADGLSGTGSDDLDLGDLGDFSMSDDPFAASGPSDTESDGLGLGDLDDFGLPGDPFAADGTSGAGNDDLGFDNLDDIGLSDDPFDVDGISGTGSDGLGLGDLDDFGLPGDPFAADGTSSAGNDDLSFDNLDDIGLSDDPFDMDGISGTGSDDLDLGDLGDLGLSDDPFAADGTSGVESEDLGLGDLDDFGLPGDPFAADGASGVEGEDLGLGDLDDFGLPGDPFVADGTSDASSDDLDLGDLGDFGVSDDPFAADGTSGAGSDDLDLGDLGDFGVSDDSFAADGTSGAGSDDLDLGDLGDFGVSDDLFAADGTSGAGSDDLDLGDLGDFGVSDDPFAADGTSGAGSDDLDMDFSQGAEFTDEPSDFGDDFDLGMGSGSADMPSDGEGDVSLDAMDDFSFPDLDKALEKSKTPAGPPAAAAQQPAQGPKTSFWNKQKPVDIPPPGSLDDIKLSESELKDLQDTLSRYPLNLRIACQEIIAERDASPEKMSKLITNLVQGVSAKETAVLAGEILEKKIIIPKGFEKSSGEALEAEKGTFGYIFVNSFLPVLRLVTVIGLLTASIFYLAFVFIFTPLRAEAIYRRGYELIYAGDNRRANELFHEAFNIHRNRRWFDRYAEAFISQRQFILAEQKYEMLLRYFPRDIGAGPTVPLEEILRHSQRDKKGILALAALQTNYMRNYARADMILRRGILDRSPNNYYALLAAGDNSLAWADEDPSRFVDARISFARLLEVRGWEPRIVERMLKYFIRTDNLGEVLNLMDWFDAHPRRNMQAATLAELGGYLLDKQSEEVRGVPNEFLGQIRGVTDILREAIDRDPSQPEAYYHLSRFYHNLRRHDQERIALEYAIRAFDGARSEDSPRRRRYRIDAHQRYANVLINDRAFMEAERELVRGVNLYQDAIRRMQAFRTPSPGYGRLFAGLGDLEYFVKTGNMEAALNHYRMAERHGWAPPEMLFRMGSAYYQLENWGNALEYLFRASTDLPLNHRVLFALGNASLKRGDFSVALGYYDRLLGMLEGRRARLPVLLPNDRPEYLELAERLMMARNNAGVASERLAAQTGDLSHRTRALGLYTEAQRAWDARTRDPATMIRSGSIPLPYLNIRNALQPQPGIEPQIFIRIDRDAEENSPWERLAPQMMW